MTLKVIAFESRTHPSWVPYSLSSSHVYRFSSHSPHPLIAAIVLQIAAWRDSNCVQGKRTGILTAAVAQRERQTGKLIIRLSDTQVESRTLALKLCCSSVGSNSFK